MPDNILPTKTSARARAVLDGAADAQAPKRLTREETLLLAEEASLHDLGAAALAERRRRFGRRAFYVYNQHVNFTNVCVNACRFCAFSAKEGAAGAYTLSIDDIRERIRERAGEPIREIHIVGGLNPRLPFAYYLDLLAAVREERPDAVIKAFTAVEVAHLADTEGEAEETILTRLKQAGLSMLPGGGAEVFSPELRKRLCPEKVSGERWLSIHAKAHALDIPTNATMLFGHIETVRDRIDHMAALRDLQDAGGGFRCFIPLAYQPGNNPLGEENGGAAGPGGPVWLQTMSLARLFLDNIDHLKAYWAFSGIKAAQMALWAGADDFDGTLVEERIGHAAGADSPKGMTPAQLRTAVAQAGFEPVERDARFDMV